MSFSGRNGGAGKHGRSSLSATVCDSVSVRGQIVKSTFAQYFVLTSAVSRNRAMPGGTVDQADIRFTTEE